MSNISVRAEAREYPDDGGNYCTLVLRSHWNFSDRVVLRIAGAKDESDYTFVIQDIRKALDSIEAAR